MKIDNVQQNYYVKPHNQRYSSPAFKKSLPKPGGMPPMSELIMENLAGKKVLKFMQEKLSWMKDEIGNVAMTAVGTGLVAPWPIAFNPFVKAPKGASEEEKKDVSNTKIYTALRQPISAVLAAVFQIGALTPIDKFLDDLYNNPETAKLFAIDTNQSVINSGSYIKTQIKKEMKAEGKTPKAMGKKEFEVELKSRIKAREADQIKALAEKIKETHKIEVGKGAIDNHKVAKLVNDQIDSYIKDAESLIIKTDGLAYYKNRAEMLLNNEEHLRKIFKDLPKDSKLLEEKLKTLLSKETNSDVKVLIEEILKKDADIRLNRVDRTLARIDKIKEACNMQYTSEKYVDFMTRRNAELEKIITELKLSKIKDLKSATPETIKKSVEDTIKHCNFSQDNQFISSILHDTKTFSTDKKGLVDKIYKDIAKGYKKFVANSYKGPNQVWKIAIGLLITLPITCNVLNWVYPRFMELVFPKLAGSKAKQAQKDKEVS